MELIIIFGCLFVVVLFIFMLLEAFRNRVVESVLEFEHYPSTEPFRIFFISDIHRRNLHHSIIKKVRGKTDVVIIGGDLTEKGVPFSRVTRNLLILKELGPVIFIWGNNDYEVEQNHLRNILHYCGVIELKNKVHYMNNDKKILFVGVDDLSQELPSLVDLFQTKEECFQILLSHNPDIVHMLPENHPISLILSGHTHGGQIRIFGFGPYRKGDMKVVNKVMLLVSNGYGTTLLPLRLGAKSETHLITIQKNRA